MNESVTIRQNSEELKTDIVINNELNYIF